MLDRVPVRIGFRLDEDVAARRVVGLEGIGDGPVAFDARRQVVAWWRAGVARVWSLVWTLWKMTAAEDWLARLTAVESAP